MTTKHSPSPWTFQEHGCFILDARTGSSQCAVAHVQMNTYKDEGMHNARLIAAAPDLLPALVEAVDLIETISPMEGDTLRRARAAIAKAVGHNFVLGRLPCCVTSLLLHNIKHRPTA
ncbi:hypothetical protein [Pseudomonas aeruginosa]|uniref:hypothetical protein n=1 Tax=Pseudomonas aeruginosa TaxID=287 RepID=UPI0015E84870|nr:hypothetical protein [Pseudomonas aeruginosa]